MTTQRTGDSSIPKADARTAALFGTAAGLTVVCGILVPITVSWGMSPALLNYLLAIMLVSWIAGFERRRIVLQRRQINELERHLWNR
ncbi:hypothetical protein ACWEOE_10635 [Amycolatopsis sp. NPDC004368]